MNIHRPFRNRLRHLSFTAALIALPGIATVQAKDTDVYLMSPTVARDDAPNVLIILDNSGSMSAAIYSRPAYNPVIDYCTGDLDTLTGISNANDGKPSNCSSIGGRIFWSFGTTPGTNSSKWFASGKNHCEDSKTVLANNGYYGGVKVVGFKSSGSGRGWKTLSGKVDGDLAYVDCQRDGSNVDGYPQAGATDVAQAYTTNPVNEFSWSGYTSYTSPKLYSANYINYWNNPNLITGSTTRLQVAKDTLKSVIDANPAFRFGLMVFNYNGTSEAANTGRHGGRVIMKVDTMDDARRTAMKNAIDSLTPSTWTPLTETLWEAKRYFAGEGVDYGDNDSSATPARDTSAESGANYISPFKYGCQTAYIIYITDGDPTNDTDANGSSRITGLPGLSSCDDNRCLDDLAGWMHNNDVYNGLPGGQRVSTFTIGFGNDISAAGLALLNDAATEGGGSPYTAADADQLSSAIRGALSEALEANTSYIAPSLSINAFNKLYNRDDVYFALFKPSSSMAWDGNVKRFKLCNGSDVTAYGCTYGDIIDAQDPPVSAIDTTTSKIKEEAVSYWGTEADGAEVTQGGAGAQITQDASVPRTLHTYRGSYAGASMPATPVAIVAASGNPVYDAAINDPTILGLPDTSGSASTTNATDTAAVTTLINWMRGQDAYDKNPSGGNGNTAETRAWNFADPLHSRPAAFTYGAELDALGNPDPDRPIIKLFVGANDGTIRIVSNDTGAEEWAFIPQELLKKQYALSQNVDGDHIYGMDDSPTFLVNDTDNDGVIEPANNDKVYMYIGMRRGVDPDTNRGNIYAFDVTPSEMMDAQSDTVTPKLIWVIQGGSGDFAKLGQTWSRPKVARIRARCNPSSVCDDGNPDTNDSESRMVLIFGGGYDTNQDSGIPAGTDTMGNAIYIVDPFTGRRLWWASSDTNASLVLPNMEYSIPSEITAIDTNGDKSVDRLYVGDTGGQVWRIDLGDQIGDANDGSSGYVFADVGCTGGSRSGDCASTGKQNRRKFFYPPDVAPVSDPTYSTSPNYDLVTIASGDREDPLDLLTSNLSPAQEAVHNRIYAFRDYNYKTGAPASTPSAMVDADMYNATDNNLGSYTGPPLQDEINSFKSTKGWYIDLKETSDVTLTNGLTTPWVGEKSLAKTIIYAGVLYVTTFVPANDATALNTCQANEGEGRYYAINYLTGVPVYDLDNDGAIERYAIAGGGIPSEVIIVIRDSGVTGLVGTSGGAKQTYVPDTPNRYKTYWYDE